MLTGDEDVGPSTTKARLFGDEPSDELRRRVAKARFLQRLAEQDSDDDATATEQPAGEGTLPTAQAFEIERVRVGRFAVLRKLGQGGMGVVYAAYDEDLDRKVALKLIRHDLARDERGRFRMQREAQALARLSHPNVVQVHEIGQFGDHDYVAMEFVLGKTLGQWLDAQPRRWSEVLDVMIQAGRGLAAAHAADLVHRDFKPANLMVGEDGRARVLDFGLARQSTDPDPSPRMPVADILATDEAEADETELGDVSGAGAGLEPEAGTGSTSRRTSAFDRMLTATGAQLGTPAYMAPEQHLGQPATALSDQFSYCVVLYEALFGRRPYEPGSRSEVAARVTEGEFVVPGPNTGVPVWLRKAVCRGLAPKPSDRWPSMDALLAELTRDRRRLWTRVGLAASLVGTLGVALAMAGESRGPLCQSDSHGIEDVWGPSARATVQRAFTDSGNERAEQRWAAVEDTLDSYAQQLVAARASACTDHFVEQAQSEAQYSLRNACLDQRRRELAVIVDALGNADTDVVERAPGILANLGDIGLCARVDLLERNVPVPKDAAAVEAIARVRDDLARGHVAIESGRLRAADLFASDARAQAEQLDYAPLIGEVAFLEGAVAHRRRDNPAAAAALLQAVRASTASQDLQLQAAAALLHARVAVRMGQGADYQLAVADAAIASLGDPLALAVERDIVRGRALRVAEQPAAALVAFDQALARTADEYPGRAHQLAQVLLERAGQLSRLGRQAEARKDLQRALALGLDPDDVNAVDALFDLGVVELEDQRYAEATRLFELALAGYERIYGPKYEFIGHGRLALAQVAINREDYDLAERHIARALEVLDEQHPEHLAVLDAMAVLERQRGADREAVAILERALALAQTSHDHAYIPEFQYQLGRSLAEVGELERALELTEAAVAALDGDPPEIMIVRPLAVRGRIERELGQLERARATLERAASLVAAERSMPMFASEVFVELALTLAQLGEHEAARQAATTARSKLAGIPEHQDILTPIASLLDD